MSNGKSKFGLKKQANCLLASDAFIDLFPGIEVINKFLTHFQQFKTREFLLRIKPELRC